MLMRIGKKLDHEQQASGRQRGFTLLELLLAMTIFLVVTGAVYGILNVAQQSRLLTNQQLHLNKSTRIALNLLGRDTYNAGFGYPTLGTVVLPNDSLSTLLNVPKDADPTRDTVPPIIAGDNLLVNKFNTNTTVRTDQLTVLFKDTTFNVVDGVSQPLSISAAKSVTGAIDLTLGSGSTSNCRVNDLYIITGNTGSALGLATGLSGSKTIKFASNDVLGLNKTGTALTSLTLPASLERVIMVTYFVTADGTLTRRVYGNAPPTGGAAPQNWRDEPLVYGVEDFQIKYVLDDGTLTDNPVIGDDKIAGTADDIQDNLKKVRQIMFTISAKSLQEDLNGKIQQVSMTSTFSTRNLGYDVK